MRENEKKRENAESFPLKVLLMIKNSDYSVA